MPIAILLFLLFLITVYFFSSKVSPIPYYPTNSKDIDKIISEMDLKKAKMLIDLGAGDGTVVFAAADQAHKLGLETIFVAVDVNPILAWIMQIRKAFHPHKKYIIILNTDMYLYSFKDLINKYVPSQKNNKIVFYIYISPVYIPRTFEMIKKLKKPTRIVSYFYPIHEAKPKKTTAGIHEIFTYDLN